MRRSRIFLTAAILGLAACRDGTGTIGPDVAPRLAPDGPSRWVDGRYPTEEEYYAELGDARPMTWADRITASFTPDLSLWTADAEVSYLFGNVGSGKLTAQVRYKDGSVINSDEDPYLFDQVHPRIVKHTEMFSLKISTLNHTCDIVGKARIEAVNAAKVFRWGGGSLVTLWTHYLNESHPDVTLPPCNASKCDDPSTPAVEECGTREGGEPYGSDPSGGGGGDCPTCIEQPPDGPTTCWVRYWYNKQTGEVLSWYILYCY